MTRERVRVRRWTVLVAVALLAIGIASPAADAKKKRKKSGPVDITKPVNQAVPMTVLVPPSNLTFGSLLSTIDVGKQFKGLRIRDVDVTVQGTGVQANSVAGALIQLTAPNGATTYVTGGFQAGTFFGPLTVDDESVNRLGLGPPPNCGGLNYLCAPYQGRVRPGPDAENYLTVFDDGPVMGQWTLVVYNQQTTLSFTFNQWRLQVTTGRPYRTK